MEAQTETTEVKKTTIRPNVENMVKTAKGSYHKDDLIGHALNGLTLDQVKVVATELGLDANKYGHLNVGQQRMNLGNGLRRLSANEEAAEKIRTLTGPMQEANAEAAAQAAAEKAAKPKKEKKAKVADSTEGEGSTE